MISPKKDPEENHGEPLDLFEPKEDLLEMKKELTRSAIRELITELQKRVGETLFTLLKGGKSFPTLFYHYRFRMIL